MVNENEIHNHLCNRQAKMQQYDQDDGDEPAVITNDGSKFWYKDGKSHREGDKPAIVTFTDRMYARSGKIYMQERYVSAKTVAAIWMQSGLIHRENNRPAVVHAAKHTAFWLRDGELARTDGGPTAVDQYGMHWHAGNASHRDAPWPASMQMDGWHVWFTRGRFVKQVQATDFSDSSLKFAFVLACSLTRQ